MRWILFLLAILALLGGLGTYATATTIMQQIAGIMTLVLFGILFSGAAIVDAVVGLTQEIRKITVPAEERVKLRERAKLKEEYRKKSERPLGSGQM